MEQCKITQKIKTIYKRDPDRNRLQILWISIERFEELLFGERPIVIKNQLPEDIRIRRVFWDDMRGCFGLVLCSQKFPELDEGNEIPSIDHINFEMIDEKNYRDQQIQQLKK